jgi:hypothetical protein
MNRPALRHEQHALALVEAAHRRVDDIHHPGQKVHPRQPPQEARDHAFVLPHSECIGDVTPRQGPTAGRCTETNTVRITPLFLRGLGSADVLQARRTTGRIER